jgi:peptidoglycan/LPS O-acetylase OafA/YrhL
MPLSEHEQRILEEIERRLVADDPKFARDVATGAVQGAALKRVRRAVALFVLGFGLLIAGLLMGGNTLIFFGIGAFAVMVASAALIASGIKQVSRERPIEAARPQGWFGRMEERWRKRYERGDST